MLKKFGINTKTIIELLSGKLTLGAFAEEPEDNNKEVEDKGGEDKKTEEPKKKDFSVNYEDLISKARKEEKDKLYPKIKDLETQVSTLTEKVNSHLLTIESKDREISDLQGELQKAKDSKVESESESVKRLQSEVEKLQKELDGVEKVDKSALEQEIEDRIKADYDMKVYRLEKLNDPEIRDNIIPELVMGTTKEEIDSSIEKAKERYNEIVNRVVDNATSKVMDTNPNTARFDTKEYSINDLANLDPRSPEYKQIREKLGLR